MKKAIYNFLKKRGYAIQKLNRDKPAMFKDIKEAEFWELYRFCEPYTMTSVERMYALYCSVNHILLSGIAGDFVECGVWRGGSSMLIAKMLVNRKIVDRKIYMYDTYEGMSEPTGNDRNATGQSAAMLLQTSTADVKEKILCAATLEEVKINMALTAFSENQLVYIKGKVEETLPGSLPEKNIALLRLDTDWYESTRHEMIHLFPVLVRNGVLIVDDYGHWEGCKKAIDEYLEANKINLLLNRVDYTCRVAIKTH